MARGCAASVIGVRSRNGLGSGFPHGGVRERTGKADPGLGRPRENRHRHRREGGDAFGSTLSNAPGPLPGAWREGRVRPDRRRRRPCGRQSGTGFRRLANQIRRNLGSTGSILRLDEWRRRVVDSAGRLGRLPKGEAFTFPKDLADKTGAMVKSRSLSWRLGMLTLDHRPALGRLRVDDGGMDRL